MMDRCKDNTINCFCRTKDGECTNNIDTYCSNRITVRDNIKSPHDDSNEKVESKVTENQVQFIEKMKDVLLKLWKTIKENFNNVWNKIKPHIKYLCKLPGFKRMCKSQQIEYYKSISYGRSNNWRKARGLPLVRKRQLRYTKGV